MPATNSRTCLTANVCLIILGLCALFLFTSVIIIAFMSQQPSDNNNLSLDDIVSRDTYLPNGSYLINVSSLEDGPPNMAPIAANATALLVHDFGVKTGDLHTVFEAGHLSYLYVLLPPTVRVGGSIDGVGAVGAIGIRFGNSESINVVPLSLADSPESGLKRFRGRQDRILYQLQIKVPTSVCPDAATSTCSLLHWRSYLISDRMVARRSAAPMKTPVACGSRCDMPSDSECAATCESCNGRKVAGTDQAVSRRYNMGVSSGKVDFEYNMYSVDDRITVWYEGKIIFDTRHVGASGAKSISFSGKSKELRVDVQPSSSESYRGYYYRTQWWFVLGCVDLCDASSANIILLHDEVNRVKAGDTVKISANAEMPKLMARYCPRGNSAKSILWSLAIKPSSKEAAPKSGKHPCEENLYTGTGDWVIDTRTVQGGLATLSWKIDDTATGSLTFFIIGTQPKRDTVISEIRKLTNIWYAEYIAKYETRNYGGYTQFRNDGHPLVSNDSGYGIFQLTDPTPTCAQVWNWRANVLAGVRIIEENRKVAVNWMDSQRKQANGSSVPTRKEGRCVFEDGTGKTIEDAVAIKMYNGASTNNQTCIEENGIGRWCTMYCSWMNKSKQWIFNPVNYLGFNYVRLVCENVP